MKKKIWQCENYSCGHFGRVKTKWIKVSNGNSVGFKVCSKCEGKVKEI